MMLMNINSVGIANTGLWGSWVVRRKDVRGAELLIELYSGAGSSNGTY